MVTPASVRVFACGMTESGKGHWLRALFLSRMARLIIVDPLGEYQQAPIPNARVYRARTIGEVRESLALAVRNGSRWVVVVQIAPDEFGELVTMLCPATLTRTPFPAAVGGCGLVCEELDLYAPSNPTPEVRSAWSRSRHVGLSIFGATQRPHGVGVIIRSQSRFHLVCRQDEPADVRYLTDYLPADAGRELPRIPWHGCLIYDKRVSSWSLLDPSGRVLKSGRGEAADLTGQGDRV